jgi:mRNA-degrading endonuclease RelE of RelBE toxin-antitoxin system
MQIRIDKTAIKDFRKAPVEITIKLIEAVARYAENRNAAVDVKAMQGQDSAFRIRVRDWRLIFTIEGETLTITKIGPRGSVYR